MPDLSGRTIKGYELQARLGEGAYGAVYRASQPQVKREVAIKIILPEYANQPISSAVSRRKRSWWHSWSTCILCRCTTTGANLGAPTW